MERDRKRQRHTLFGKTVYSGNDARSGQRDAAIADVQHVFFMQQAQEIHDIFIIHQRLSRSHQDHGVDLPALRSQHFLDEENLGEHFPRRQITRQSMQGRCAEGAAHIATRLRRYAYTVAVRLTHEHGFHGRTVGKGEQELARPAVGGVEPRAQKRRVDRVPRLKFRAQGLRQIRHVGKTLRTFLVEPFRHLPRAVFFQAQGSEILLHRFERHAENVLHAFTFFSCGR